MLTVSEVKGTRVIPTHVDTNSNVLYFRVINDNRSPLISGKHLRRGNDGELYAYFSNEAEAFYYSPYFPWCNYVQSPKGFLFHLAKVH